MDGAGRSWWFIGGVIFGGAHQGWCEVAVVLILFLVS